MQLNIKVEGLGQVRNLLANTAKQVNFAASKALNTTAFAINTKIKADMASAFAGGATAYSLRAFKVARADKNNLTALVSLRDDNQGAALPYNKALGHLFTGGQRKYKKIEGMLRARKLIPNNLTIAPGDAMRLDRFGNMEKGQLTELMTMLLARPSTMRTIRKTGKGKLPKMIDYFVVQPGAKTRLHPGIYKRIETGKTSAIDAMILYIKPINYRKFIDLQKIGTEVATKTFWPAFDAELEAANKSAHP